MKLRDITNIKYIFTRKNKKSIKNREFYLSVNDKIIPKWKIMNNTSTAKTIKMLKNFQIPQYETGYLLRNKKGFQTIFFNQNYDVVVSDRDGKVLKTFISVNPGYFSKYFASAHFVYFFPVGTINFLNINKKDVVIIKRFDI
ncbi:hypothetical protein MYMA111404_02475 [Mycoplasma marinum]|uniref:DUF192 domain-containing protein n=1 Tax=Mycoplasma marinum TaxID=1937190 RepID=A0A4R0XNQ2_9MOLU|nr:hypothetical protein [Mycoplasma marinum]TCG10585.1 hypothetical protein C4B24_04440 [Mycoplasma marinum]